MSISCSVPFASPKVYFPGLALKIGIVGLPNVGKSTLFNALTRSRGAQAANYPFCTIEPNVGIVEVPDSRLWDLAKIVDPKKVVPAAIEFVDIAGLVRGASKGEGLGNKFLAAIREVDAICEVVRCFTGGDILHVEGTIDPKRDREIIEAELQIADLDSVTKRLEKIRQAAKTGDKEKAKEVAAFEKIETALKAGTMAIAVDLTEDEELLVSDIHLLTRKPFLYAANVAESDLAAAKVEDLRAQIGLPSSGSVVAVSAKLEEDLIDLSPEEGSEFLRSLGVHSSGLDRLVRTAYEALGYITYFTAGPQEVRAWNVMQGATAPQAAGVIHTDFERGFICADTIAFADYIAGSGEAGAKLAGKLRQEGKSYRVNDGDVMHFKFNV